MNALEITPDKQLIAAAGKTRIPGGIFNIFPELRDFNESRLQVKIKSLTLCILVEFLPSDLIDTSELCIYMAQWSEDNYNFQAYCFSYSKDLSCLGKHLVKCNILPHFVLVF